MTTASLPIRPAQSRQSTWYWIQFAWLCTGRKRQSLGSCSSTADQGFQYTSQAYFNLIKSYDITPSMSRRANPYDNAMAENFFSILKAECIYRHKPASFCEANEMIDRYIYFYNHERIQLKTGEPPLTRRLST